MRGLPAQNGAAGFSGQIAAWLWYTVVFANFAKAVVEGRGKAQADALRRTLTDTCAKRLIDPDGSGGMQGAVEGVSALDLKIGGIVLVEAGDLVPGDGEISTVSPRSTNRQSLASWPQSSARLAVTVRLLPAAQPFSPAGFKVKITAAPGSTFIDRMIALVEGAGRQKVPNKLALSILLSGLTIIFLIVCVTLRPLVDHLVVDALGSAAQRQLSTSSSRSLSINSGFRNGRISLRCSPFLSSRSLGTLASRLRAQSQSMRGRAQASQSLFEFSRNIAGAASLDDVLWASAVQAQKVFDARCVLLLLPDGGELRISAACPPVDQLNAAEECAAHWAREKSELAGWRTGTLPNVRFQFRPRTGAKRIWNRATLNSLDR